MKYEKRGLIECPRCKGWNHRREWGSIWRCTDCGRSHQPYGEDPSWRRWPFTPAKRWGRK